MNICLYNHTNSYFHKSYSEKYIGSENEKRIFLCIHGTFCVTLVTRLDEIYLQLYKLDSTNFWSIFF